MLINICIDLLINNIFKEGEYGKRKVFKFYERDIL